MGFDFGRGLAAVGTGGTSEVVRGAQNGGLFGFGKPGESAQNSFANSAAYHNATGEADRQANNAGLQGALDKVRNPDSSTAYATDQVQSNPLFAGMFGQQGYAGKLMNEQDNLSNTGYSLTPQDHEAYGQASDNAARMFGQQGNQVASQLASHGLAAGGSGGAAVAYSGLAGNQNEQLAQAQRSIANDRMSMNLQRLNSVRGAITNTQQQAQNALNSQESQNQRGVDNYNNTQNMALGAEEGAQNQFNNQFTQQQVTKTPTFGEMLGSGISNQLGSTIGKAGSGLGSKTPTPPPGGTALAGGADSGMSAAMLA